jgi:hypothetical protein
MSYVAPGILLYSFAALVSVAVVVVVAAAAVVAVADAAAAAAAAAAVVADAADAAEAATLVGSLDAGNVSAVHVAAAAAAVVVEEHAAAYVAVASGKRAAVVVDFSFRSFVVSFLTQGSWGHAIYECHARGSVWQSGDDLIEVG